MAQNIRWIVKVKYTNGGSYSETVLGNEAWARTCFAEWQQFAEGANRVQSVTLETVTA